ncbi:MAG: hypothetical protein AB8B54_00085 [Sphingorhabdus sp.]
MAMFWILMRIIVWNVPYHPDIGPKKPLQARETFADSVLEGEFQRPCLTGCSDGGAIGFPGNLKQGENVMMLIDRPVRNNETGDMDSIVSMPRLRHQAIQPRIDATPYIPDGFLEAVQKASPEIVIHASPLQKPSQRRPDKGLESYFWTFVRQATRDINSSERIGSPNISNGQYGGSQVGMMLSYPIAGQPGPDVIAYARVTAALAPLRQEEVAFGMRVRPMKSIPFSLYAEKRFGLDSGSDQGLAVFVAGGTNPKRIIEKLKFETYGQAGYVGGKAGTYFYDGSATLQRSIVEHDRKKLAIGAGVWAGGQRDIARVDIGPRADFEMPLGSVSARIAVDWRFRVVGNAQPESGLAITVSSGF